MKNKTELIVVASLSAAILSLIFIILFIMVYLDKEGTYDLLSQRTCRIN